MKGINIAIIGNRIEHIRQIITSFCSRFEELPVCEIRLFDQNDQKIGPDILKDLEILNERTEYRNTILIQITESIGETLRNADFVVYCGYADEISEDVFRTIYASYLEQNKIISTDVSKLINDMFAKNRSNLREICSNIEIYCSNAWLIITQPLSGLMMEMVTNNYAVKICGLPDLTCRLFTYFENEIGDDVFIDYVGTDLHGYLVAVKDGGGVNQIDYLLRKKKYRQLLNETKFNDLIVQTSEMRYLTTEFILLIIQSLDNGEDSFMFRLTELVCSLYNDRKSVQILNTSNNGALSCIGDSDIITITSLVSREGIIPFSLELCDYEDIINNLKLQKDFEKNIIKYLT